MAFDDGAPGGGARLRARVADSLSDLRRAQRLRHRAFHERAGRPALPGELDADAWDAVSTNILVEDTGSGELVCAYRYRLLSGAEAAASSYTGQHYDLGAWAGLPGPLLELGRFCLGGGGPDPDVLRVAWGEIAGLVRARGVTLMFGCSSFPGTDPVRHRDSLALLRRHAAPADLAPRPLAAETLPLPAGPDDPGAAARGLPPLLRSYLALGGWVSDHAVVDRALDTLHVLTAVEVARIPAARTRTLMALA